jgi:hypothetical protein
MKVLYSLFICVLIPVYTVNFGWTIFLWFCDVALLVTLIAIWRESSFLVSSQLVGILFIQSAWMVDFAYGLVLGITPIGLASYMFFEDRHLYLRLISLYHIWFPIFLIWLVYRLGYARRAWQFQIVLLWLILAASYVLVDDPFLAAGNVNLTFGFSSSAVQQWVSLELWVLFLMISIPLVIYIPTHGLSIATIKIASLHRNARPFFGELRSARSPSLM